MNPDSRNIAAEERQRIFERYEVGRSIPVDQLEESLELADFYDNIDE